VGVVEVGVELEVGVFVAVREASACKECKLIA
jgi:hypothetical protein